MQLWQIKGRHEATETMARETKDGDSEKATTVAATTATGKAATTASSAVQGHVKGNDRSQTIVQVAGVEAQQQQQ